MKITSLGWLKRSRAEEAIRFEVKAVVHSDTYGYYTYVYTLGAKKQQVLANPRYEVRERESWGGI